MEHHSNILPWRYKYPIDYVEVDNKEDLNGTSRIFTKNIWEK